MLRFWNLARYPKKIEMEGARPLHECQASLVAMTRSYFDYGRNRRKRPFVGYAKGLSGRLWYPRRVMLAATGRALQFQFEANAESCRLRGEMEVVLPIRIYSAMYLIFCAVATPIWIWASVRAGGTLLYELKLLAQGTLCGVGSAYVFNGLSVLAGRRAERQMLKILQHVINDAKAETIIVDLLDS